MPNQPVQIVTNPQRLRQRRDKNPPGSAGTDFFEGNNAGFVRHRDRLAMQLSSIIQALSAPDYVAEYGGLGYVLVRMHERAIAKSHRPQTRLFKKKAVPHVATDRIGEPIFACTPETLRGVLERLVAAEIEVGTKALKTGEVVPNPTRARCETSAIASIELWTAADKRSFDAEDGASWLSQSGTGGRYHVELFPFGGPSAPASLTRAGQSAARALQRGLDQAPVDTSTQSVRGVGLTRALSVAVVDPNAPRRVELGILSEEVGTALRSRGNPALSRDVDEHARVLNTLELNPLVRAITLPPLPSTTQGVAEQTGALALPVLPGPDEQTRPIIGVLDGGVGDVLDPWVVDRWTVISPSDTDAQHGTFISGLLVAAGPLNPSLLDPTRPACRIVDLKVLPADPGNTGMLFGRYYPGGAAEFLDEIEDAVRDARKRHNVRVFNLSVNFDAPGDDTRYGFAAQRLDEIARRHDVIFVISGGNLPPTDYRTEWGDNPDRNLAALVRETRTTISEPAESLFNVAVSALNPPGIPGQVPFALTRYSRRGPGLRGATKPDLAHVGGTGTYDGIAGYGLLSIDEAGAEATDCGTSFAAPLVARELADLDAAIQGDVPRETLLALLVHDARMPKQLKKGSLGAVATQLAGFGIPSQTHHTLERPDSEIVMVFNSTVMPREEHSLDFSWPAALTTNGKCRGYAKLTLVARPILAYEHGDERIRVNIDAKLMQQNEEGGFNNVLKAVHHPDARSDPKTERELLRESHKWQVVKSFETANMRGRGSSSTWRFFVEYLTRAEEDLPLKGVEFAAVLTISDPKGEAPVFQQMRQQLSARGVQTADIRAGIRNRVNPRV
ncbi:S8 family peptidase [Curtobacterium flaccumfaciens]|uniref:S8 family peptidase n=1 Tax=Curtobacterium flaccumfaciens TaxID=2035 RepID=UPI0022087298|nr:S8 family peptidase [Curtobacterium flaccumfaciens]UWD79260.1 S8 family peptidase [Curtobacterium flaccumfaciens]